MPEFDLAFSASLTEETGHFKLLELPTEICALVENSLTPLRFSVKGQSSEDAVLCTPDDKTYTIRSVVLSNNILVVTSDPENDAAVVVRDQLTEILELTPTLPKLEKLTALLRGRDLDDVADNADGEPEPGISYEDAKSLIQASDGELASTLRKRRILDIRGKLRPIAPSYLTTILETILNHIVAQGLKPEAVPASELSATLADENEISVAVSMQVMTWFGNLNDGVWVLDVPAVVREIGLDILRAQKHEPLTREELLRRWKLAVGDTFEASVALDLLSGNYLETASTGLFSADTLTYFPSSALPVEPASRFADLFLTRQRWRAEDISPFLSDIALNNKERDKLLLKYTRTTTDSGGQVYYTKR